MSAAPQPVRAWCAMRYCDEALAPSRTFSKRERAEEWLKDELFWSHSWDRVRRARPLSEDLGSAGYRVIPVEIRPLPPGPGVGKTQKET